MGLTRVLIVVTGLALAPAVAEPNGEESARTSRRLFDYARAKNVSGIEEIEKSKTASTPEMRVAAAIALFIADPERFDERLVADFPTDRNGVMGIVYEGIELQRDEKGEGLTPEFLFSFSALADIAMRGDELAAKKFFMVTATSDGVVAELLCERTLDFLSRRAGMALDGLLQVSSAERAVVIGKCSLSASRDEAAAATRAIAALGVLGKELDRRLAPESTSPGDKLSEN